jgi:hypothetical protein
LLNAWKQAQADAAKGPGLFGGRTPITLEEAQMILNISPNKLPTLAQLQKDYERMYTANERGSGGSFYIQGRIYRAKERIDEALAAGEISLPQGPTDAEPTTSSRVQEHEPTPPPQ